MNIGHDPTTAVTRRQPWCKDLSIHSRHASHTPCGQARGRTVTHPRGTTRTLRFSPPTPSGVSSLHDNKRTGQSRTEVNATAIQFSSWMFSSRSTPTLLVQPTKVGGAKPDRAQRRGQDLKAGGATNQSWWSQTGSNRRPQACKASALPTELWPRPVVASSPTSILPNRISGTDGCNQTRIWLA